MSPVKIRRETDLDEMIRRPFLGLGIAVGFGLCWVTGLLLFGLLLRWIHHLCM